MSNKSWIKHWGYSLKNILKMPRKAFAVIHGKRFLKMSHKKFLKTLRNEIPNKPNIKIKNIDAQTYKDLQRSFTYDEKSILI